MRDEPLVDEDEEEAPQVNGLGDAIRRVFGAGQRSSEGVDNFTGAFRGVPAPKRGGTAYVKPEDTLGDDQHCWCGELAGHDWPGKTERAPHPRVTVQEKEDNMASAAASVATNNERLDKRQLRKFDDRVARMVMDLTNTYGVRWRMQRDGVHILLYPLNDAFEGRPHKVGAARHAEQTMAHLEKWVEQAVTPALVKDKAELLAAKFNDPSKVRKVRSAARPSAPETPPVEAPSAEVVDLPVDRRRVDAPPIPDYLAAVPAPGHGWRGRAKQWPTEEEYNTLPEGVDPTPPEGYVRALDANKRPLNWWVNADGSHYICMWRDYDADELNHSAAHQRKHSQTPEQLSEAARKGNQGRSAKRMNDRVLAAVNAILDATGVEYPVGDNTEKDKTIAELDAKVTTLGSELNLTNEKLALAETQRDEYKAKLALLKEALSL